MKISELILMLEQIENKDQPIKVSVETKHGWDIKEFSIGGLMVPTEQYKDWSILALCPNGTIHVNTLKRLQS